MSVETVAVTNEHAARRRIGIGAAAYGSLRSQERPSQQNYP